MISSQRGEGGCGDSSDNKELNRRRVRGQSVSDLRKDTFEELGKSVDAVIRIR